MRGHGSAGTSEQGRFVLHLKKVKGASVLSDGKNSLKVDTYFGIGGRTWMAGQRCKLQRGRSAKGGKVNARCRRRCGASFPARYASS